jgi:seryl-tRNA synthetase
MWPPEQVLRVLRERGELWESGPGLVGLRGDVLALYRALEQTIAGLARSESADEWRVPAGLSLETLARADYFASFPQWLTAVSHLSEDPTVLERVATATDPAAAARSALAPADAVLPPAVCYHTYAALAGTVVSSPTTMTAQGTCWRHEGDRLAPLERGWAFTMREIVCLGAAEDIDAFRLRGIEHVGELASVLGLERRVIQASDPFFAPAVPSPSGVFAPTARGKALLQRVKALKHELLLTLAPGRSIAAASFNHHETFFGEAFDIRLPSGRPAASGCIAFGIERWLLAFLVTHGPDAGAWPAIHATSVAGGIE